MDTKQAELELSEIKRIMEDSRRIMIDDGTGFILWGSLVAMGLISSYLSVLGYLEWKVSSIAWFALIGLGWLITIFQLRREKKERKAVSFAGKVAGAIWGSAGITMTIIGFVGSYSGLVKGMGISPLMACVLAVLTVMIRVRHLYRSTFRQRDRLQDLFLQHSYQHQQAVIH